jgi:hypothetical protein
MVFYCSSTVNLYNSPACSRLPKADQIIGYFLFLVATRQCIKSSHIGQKDLEGQKKTKARKAGKKKGEVGGERLPDHPECPSDL